MKNIFRLVRCGGFLSMVFCLFTTTNPLHAQWIQTNGPYGGGVISFAVSGTNLFAGTIGGVWRRPLSEMITSVERLSTDLPTHFSLNQNYPNPFNPITSIELSLPNRGYVSLKVFNVLGQKIAALVAEELNAGTYTTQWNGTAMPSGIYYYRLQTSGHS